MASVTKEEGIKEKSVVNMRQLLECGGHFGHQTKRWNPKMKKYIFTARNGIHVIDLQQSIKLIKVAYNAVKEVVKKNGTVLFIGTKKQAQDAIATEAARCGMPYVNHRWLGGTLTNNITIRQSVNKLKQYQRMEEDGTFDAMSNKEAAKKIKEKTKLSYYLDGIKTMNALPMIVFIVDTHKEQIAVKEANRLNIPIVGVVDTNADPTEIQYPVPANDDAIRAIKLICSIISQAVLDAKEEMSDPVEKEIESALDKAGESKDDEKNENTKTVIKKKETETKSVESKGAEGSGVNSKQKENEGEAKLETKATSQKTTLKNKETENEKQA
ncbi:MAG: 30S ribosomal protein S2 [bacterium]|nr:30S ribosomal protein S2 [bacterium]